MWNHAGSWSLRDLESLRGAKVRSAFFAVLIRARTQVGRVLAWGSWVGGPGCQRVVRQVGAGGANCARADMVNDRIGNKGPIRARWGEVEIRLQPGEFDCSVPSGDV